MAFTSETAKAAGSKPKRRDFLTQHILAELKELHDGQVTKARALVIALIGKAIEGDIPATREVLDRVEGKVAQLVGNDPENPLDMLGGLGAAIDSKLDRLIAGRVAKPKGEPDR